MKTITYSTQSTVLQRNSPNFEYLNITNKSILIGDFNADSPTWGYSDINAAGREIKNLLHTKPVELIFKKDDPGTFLHYNGYMTSPDLLIVSSDTCKEGIYKNSAMSVR